jgi:hypothetical protein
MITPLHARAIGQILTLSGEPLGTGFLIADKDGCGKVLTAGHVAEELKTVKIRFDKADKQECISRNIVKGKHDWALLTIDSPKEIAPLALYPPPPTNEEVRWWTIGYPKLVAHTRATFHGDVRLAEAEEIDLQCVELPLGGPAAAATGLSGAPCLIDGGVAGILRDVLRCGKQSPTNPTSAMFALPSQIIAREAGLPYADGTRPDLMPSKLPYELSFTAVVESWCNASRQIAAGIAKLDGGIVYPPCIIARRMINEGLNITGLVLKGLMLPTEQCRRLIELAETLWVNGQAALHMDDAIESGTPALLLTNSDISTRHHLARAFAYRNDGAPTWDYVHIGETHRDLNEVIDEVDDRLKDHFDSATSTQVERLIDKNDARERITVFLHGSPRPDLTQRLKGRWPKLRIVYFIDVEISTVQDLGISIITPKHSQDQENDAMALIKRWRRKLELLPTGGAR